jgi:hypothetical protein
VSLENYQEIGWLLVCMLPFFFIQARLHRELKLFFYLILRKDSYADMLFYILFFPGILVHESSHWLMAKLVRVPTGKLSLIPRNLPNGKLRLGYVETQKSDWFRDSLIGVAPLITGCVITGWIANTYWSTPTIAREIVLGDLQTLRHLIPIIYSRSYFWVWFYLVFTISSMMLPSESDRNSWVPVLLIFIGIILFLIIIGAGGWMEINLLPLLNPILTSLTTVFAVSLSLHFILLIPVWLFRAGLEKVVGYP